jgi:hypothetical protein
LVKGLVKSKAARGEENYPNREMKKETKKNPRNQRGPNLNLKTK